MHSRSLLPPENVLSLSPSSPDGTRKSIGLFFLTIRIGPLQTHRFQKAKQNGGNPIVVHFLISCFSIYTTNDSVCARSRIRATGSSRMAAASQSVASFCSGLVHRSSHAKLPFGIRQCNGAKIDNCNYVSVTSRRIVRGRGIQYLTARRVGTICAASVGGDYRQLRIDDDSPQEPYFLSLVKEAVWGLRSLFVFLVEQPSQLKYIEWPGFRSTLKTATLTLVLVALLIVALSSTDSALSYLLALILRRTP